MKKDIESYAHRDKERANNPPVGLVTPATDKDAGGKTYAHDPHIDPQLSWAGKGEHTSVASTGDVIEQVVEGDCRTSCGHVGATRWRRKSPGRRSSSPCSARSGVGRVGWIDGGIDHLASYIEHAAMSERRVAEGSAVLEDGVRQAAARLARLCDRQGDQVLGKVSVVLQQESGEQTNEAYRDDFRQEMDAAILCDLLGLPTSILEPLATLRLAWCAEPTVHGGKSTKP